MLIWIIKKIINCNEEENETDVWTIENLTVYYKTINFKHV